VTVSVPSYKGFRFPAEIIGHCVWLYHRFPLSLREIEEMMLGRGIILSHETVRRWCAKFGQTYANALRRRPGAPGGQVARRRSVHHDQRSATLPVASGGSARERAGHLVTSRRDTTAATRFFRKLLKGLEYVPRVLITDKLRSYGAARRRVMRSVEHRRSKYLNNRAENSHQPTRQRERAMKDSPQPGTPSGSYLHSPASPPTSGRPSPAIRPGVPPRND
jgi:putative transposase